VNDLVSVIGPSAIHVMHCDSSLGNGFIGS
jgi:hypothetical protein